MPFDVPDVPTDESGGYEPRGQRAVERVSQNTEMTTLHVETFRSNIRPHWKLRWKYRWLRLRLGKKGRALADELGRRIEATILFGEGCDRCNTMASCKLTGYECQKTGRAP